MISKKQRKASRYYNEVVKRGERNRDLIAQQNKRTAAIRRVVAMNRAESRVAVKKG